MVGPSLILLVFLLPATIAGVALMLGARTDPASRRIGGVGVGLGLLAGYLGLVGKLPQMPPHDANGALFWVLAGTTLAAWFEGSRRSSPLVQLPLRVLICVLAPMLYLKNLVKNWDASQVFEQIGPIALASLLLWTAMDRLARARPGATVPLALWVAASGASLALFWATFAINSQLAGTLAAVMGAAVVASWIWSRASLAGGAAGVASVALATLCAGGVHLSELPPLAGLLIVVGPLAAWVAGPLGAGMSPAKGLLLRIALVAIPVAAGCWIAYEHRPPPNPYADYY